MKTTKESLGIFWEGEEVDGIILYGFFLESMPNPPVFPTDIWHKKCDWKSNKLEGEGWTVWIWEIRIDEWPKHDEWRQIIKETLRALIAQGASVAWAGLEGFFVDPPDLFNPEFMSGGVWAVYTSSGEFVCQSGIDEVFKTIDDSTLMRMQSSYL